MNRLWLMIVVDHFVHDIELQNLGKLVLVDAKPAEAAAVMALSPPASLDHRRSAGKFC